jgi:dTDP-4-amino-4,6-dideoxygalactose transaminase
MSRWKVTLADNTVDDQEIAAVTEVLRGRWLSAGPQTAAFEREFADRLGVPDAVAVSSGTAALHLAVLALGIGPGDEVVLPSLSFVSAAAMVALHGGTPVFADVRSVDDLTIDPAEVERLITPRTKAVVAMHYGGFPADLPALAALCAAKRIALIEDAAHAPIVETAGGMLGTVGDIGCFSFFATKNITTGEGGMVVARDPAVLAHVRRARSHQLTASTWERLESGDADYDVPGLGLNYRPTEVASAIGRIQLGRAAADRERRTGLVYAYREALAPIENLVVPFATHQGDSAHHLMAVLLPAGVNRRAVREALTAAGVQTSMHYPPTHRFTYYRDRFPGAAQPLPVTETAGARLLSLPLHSRMARGDAELTAGALADAVHRSRQPVTENRRHSHDEQ